MALNLTGLHPKGEREGGEEGKEREEGREYGGKEKSFTLAVVGRYESTKKET